VRKEPLLNTNAAASPIAPLAFNSPAKADVKGGQLKGFEDLKGPLFSEAVAQASELGLDEWNLPDDHFDPSGSHVSFVGSTRRDKPRRTHRGGSAVRKSPAAESPTKLDASVTHTLAPQATPASFDWGPLPTFASPTPLKTLPISFVPISPPANFSGETKPLGPPKNIPKGFVGFSTVSPSGGAANGNVPKGFTFAPSDPSQGFSFSKILSQQK